MSRGVGSIHPAVDTTTPRKILRRLSILCGRCFAFLVHTCQVPVGGQVRCRGEGGSGKGRQALPWFIVRIIFIDKTFLLIKRIKTTTAVSFSWIYSLHVFLNFSIVFFSTKDPRYGKSDSQGLQRPRRELSWHDPRRAADADNGDRARLKNGSNVSKAYLHASLRGASQ